MNVFHKSERTTLQRLARLGSYDKPLVHGIIDRAVFCHAGFVDNGEPVVIPCLHGREGDLLLFHGSHASRLMKTLVSGERVCLAFTLFNGLVMARAAFAHSALYESVIGYGRGTEISEETPKRSALKAISDHLFPGRWEQTRPPTEHELAATCVAGVILEEASAKISSQGPEDRPGDRDWPAWAGILPSHTTYGPPQQDPAQDPSIPFPACLAALVGSGTPQ